MYIYDLTVSIEKHTAKIASTTINFQPPWKPDTFLKRGDKCVTEGENECVTGGRQSALPAGDRMRYRVGGRVHCRRGGPVRYRWEAQCVTGGRPSALPVGGRVHYRAGNRTRLERYGGYTIEGYTTSADMHFIVYYRSPKK